VLKKGKIEKFGILRGIFQIQRWLTRLDPSSKKMTQPRSSIFDLDPLLFSSSKKVNISGLSSHLNREIESNLKNAFHISVGRKKTLKNCVGLLVVQFRWIN